MALINIIDANKVVFSWYKRHTLNRIAMLTSSSSIIQLTAAQLEERAATLALLKIGLQLVECGTSISGFAGDQWLKSYDDQPFPEPDTFEK